MRRPACDSRLARRSDLSAFSCCKGFATVRVSGDSLPGDVSSLRCGGCVDDSIARRREQKLKHTTQHRTNKGARRGRVPALSVSALARSISARSMATLSLNGGSHQTHNSRRMGKPATKSPSVAAAIDPAST